MVFNCFGEARPPLRFGLGIRGTRKIKAKRGRILDRNGIVLADNQPVCTISVIHNQIRDPNAVIALLCSKLGLSEETVRKRVEKVSSIEKIKI
mgnify:CR=1 FL=1